MNERERVAVDEAVLADLERLEQAATGAPWVSLNEEDGGLGGESFIQTTEGDPAPDIYAYIKVADDGWHKAAKADQDFIAAARNTVPLLIAEIRRLRGEY